MQHWKGYLDQIALGSHSFGAKTFLAYEAPSEQTAKSRKEAILKTHNVTICNLPFWHAQPQVYRKGYYL
jgi:hypothetical protein